jgi:site-specific DNA recombinase
VVPVGKKKNSINAPSAIAVIYARYSDHNQKDVSIEQQVAECEEYAAQNNMTVVNIYADRAITGKIDKRPEFQKMMRHAEKRQFQVIIAWKSNRMARNMLHALQYEDKLAKFGVRVVYAKEEFGDNAAGRFALRTMMNVNQFYSENMSEDIIRGMYDNAEKCMITNGGLPFGYRKGEDGRYAIDEAEAPIVKEIFRRYANGEKLVDIASDLNGRGIKTSRGRPWGRSSFHSILRNERYTGVYIYGDFRKEGGVPQIIGKELFYAVQEKLPSKKTQGRHRGTGDYLLTGKLYCGKCKSHMVGVSGTGKSGKLHHYYVCQQRRTAKTCDKGAVRRDWLEQEVATSIKVYLLNDEVIHWIANTVMEYQKKNKDRPQIVALEKQLAQNKKAITNMLAAIEQGIITPSTKERLMELESEQVKIEARLAVERAEIPDVTKEDVVAWLELFRDGDINDKAFQAKLFDMFLVAIYLYDNNFKLVFNFTGKKKSIRVPLQHSVIDNVGNNGASDCSYRLPLGLPYRPNEAVSKLCFRTQPLLFSII